ncbi:UDP-N-acetylmuramoyl-L-alanyl-D-glutamate--2,6-diaminopimelate ligase [Marinithermofilum abyssi]|uniref:UDP-N-acetylmuramoyl-L-alanyl-D-glutamate--2,6-diaminopimelate ligase n=1 Tax=Marinithermofilum abyssi TaxID=1571185 RepID=A0A8J2YE09_9BACL|nr:UDP-N-acetylmuramoyl-L-alanyl-D-glutamate--2,6-diaminopimelate ligase [Marinithermofilum abyssi]GGE22572.1 UDP-N-acetylmuramoyl-L-alanyl-D-glutamate--2,6-diaminopimelate ligase [Marinithermofilum abyssi]
MRLSDLIRPLFLAEVAGDRNVDIRGIQTDSRHVQPGDLFIALKGFTVDGHRYVEQAVNQGAAAVLVQEPVETSVTRVLVPDTRRAMAVVAAAFYRHPTRELKLIGVTGTNGKTTTVHLIQHILQEQGKKTGIIGTINMRIGEKTYPVRNTTPDVDELQKSFRMMADAGCHYALIEVSSHALDLGRTRGCEFRTGVFTNLSQDHLDYHQTMEKYRDAKGLLFTQLGNRYGDEPTEQPLAVLNADEEASGHFARITSAQVITYGIDRPADVRAENIRYTSNGTHFTLHTFKGSVEMSLKMMGKFSVYNALAATAVALGEGISLEDIARALANMQGVAGRLERVDEGQPFTVLVDYAHTPDGLENVLSTITEFAEGRIFCVVGCGGDRDRTKRPIMAKIAAQYSDVTVITSDNPRTEEPQQIVDDMLEGLCGVPAEKYTVILNRAEAIHHAVKSAKPGDVVLIAGKGHETYQEVNGVRHDFDDRQVAREAIQQRKG